MTHRTDIPPHALGHPSRDDIIRDLRDQLATASHDIERLAAANDALRAEVRRLSTAMGLPPVGWLPKRPGVAR